MSVLNGIKSHEQLSKARVIFFSVFFFSWLESGALCLTLKEEWPIFLLFKIDAGLRSLFPQCYLCVCVFVCERLCFASSVWGEKKDHECALIVSASVVCVPDRLPKSELVYSSAFTKDTRTIRRSSNARTNQGNVELFPWVKLWQCFSAVVVIVYFLNSRFEIFP